MVDFRERVDGILRRCTDTFGEQVTLYPKKGGVHKIRAIFDNEHTLVDPDTEQPLSAQQPMLGINLNDVPVDIVYGDIFEVRNIRYRVIENREDGQGGASIFLHRLNDNEKVNKRPYSC